MLVYSIYDNDIIMLTTIHKLKMTTMITIIPKITKLEYDFNHTYKKIKNIIMNITHTKRYLNRLLSLHLYNYSYTTTSYYHNQKQKSTSANATTIMKGNLDDQSSSFHNLKNQTIFIEPKRFHYDCHIVIYGTTPAGIIAAISSARILQRKHDDEMTSSPFSSIHDDNYPIICLISVSYHIGGMVSSGLGITDIGPYPNLTIGGITKEFFQRNYKYYYNYNNNIDIDDNDDALYNIEPHVGEYIFRQMIQEYDTIIQLIENTGDVIHVDYIESNNHTNYKNNVNDDDNTSSIPTQQQQQRMITSIQTTNGYQFDGIIFIDASYEGDLIGNKFFYNKIEEQIVDEVNEDDDDNDDDTIQNTNTNGSQHNEQQQQQLQKSRNSNIISYTIGRENQSTYNESYNGNLMKNDGHQFIVSVNPFIDNNNDTLLPYLLTSKYANDIGTIGVGENNKMQSYTFRLCLSNNIKYQIPFPKPKHYNPIRWELLRRYIHELNIRNITKQYLHIPTSNTHLLFPSSSNNENSSRNESSRYYKFDCNNGGPISTDYVGGSWNYIQSSYKQRTIIYEEHKQYILELFYFLLNDSIIPIDIRNEMKQYGLCNDEFISSNDNWPPQLYIREGRRIIGDEVFTQNDIEYQKQQQKQQQKQEIMKKNYKMMNEKYHNYRNTIGLESIGSGSYNYDSHTIQRMVCNNCSTIFNNESSNYYTWNEGDLERSPGIIYQIPMYILFPKINEIYNIITPTCGSTSHVTFNTIRMEPQFMILGQTAGTIAAIYYMNYTKTMTAIDDTTTNTTISYMKRTRNMIPVQMVDRQVVRDELIRYKQQVE